MSSTCEYSAIDYPQACLQNDTLTVTLIAGGAGLSGGAVAAIVIIVLLLLGSAGFAYYWFKIRPVRWRRCCSRA